MIIQIDKNLSHKQVCWPTYPPYHSGLYFEQYFIDRFIKENPPTTRAFIPIHWTSVYKDRLHSAAQSAILSSISSNTPTFTVSTDDDAPHFQIPNNLAFSAGGLVGDVPIPLVCSQIPENLLPKKPKDIFCSFVGSITHPIRSQMIQILGNNKDYHLSWGAWKDAVGEQDKMLFLDKMSRSVFSLAPRGYGATSYRLYEALQMGSIPVYISDKHWLPFEDEIDWTSFCVVLGAQDIPHLDLILKNISQDQINSMVATGESVYKKYFTFDSIYDRIIREVS